MKKLLLSVAALMIAGLSFGQVKFGIVAGPQFSSYTTKANGQSKETSKLLTSVRAGITVDLPLADEFYIGTGLLYSGKGGQDKAGSNISFKSRLSYLQLPINFLFKPEVGSGNLVLGVGPYIAYGLGGKHEGNFAGLVNVERKAFDDEAGAAKLKRFDAGAGLVVGYELKGGLNFGLNADLGLVNAYDNTDNGRRWKNTSFGVSVGYKF
ncbi:PorT family protein [Chitinophaga pendula]|uniref:outer membrane beta-barrel protein n=1 Tax=Chitinophaga TaxID=79328 RepID=UPI0012FD2E53|nr:MULTISPECIES: outer membrane beta-barrel protein [Chitinophaga]UCJ06555.1 PorT family protein [Chitinophaga pendula]